MIGEHQLVNGGIISAGAGAARAGMAKLAIGTSAITFSKSPQNSRRDQVEPITSRLQSGTGLPRPKLRWPLYHAVGVVSKAIWVPEPDSYSICQRRHFTAKPEMR